MKNSPAVLIANLLLLVASHAGAQGDLDPANAPAPTMKRLDEVEPRIAVNFDNTPGDGTARFKIREPGSYYFTGGVVIRANYNGIEIAASNVTLDLMGYTLEGIPAFLPQKGIHVAGGLTNICIKNGSIVNFQKGGVDGSTAANSRLADLRVSGCRVSGLDLGLGGAIERCSARENHVGMKAAFVTDCLAFNNTGSGIEGVQVSNCRALGNWKGIVGRGGAATITNCSASGNIGDGFVLPANSDGSLIRNCTSSYNTGNGISAVNGCRLVENNCYDNDGAGILVTGTNCVIRGNMMNLNTNGIFVTGTRNLIIGNMVRSCPPHNYDIADGNRLGPLVSPAVNVGRIQENGTLNTNFGTTDPWANLNY